MKSKIKFKDDYPLDKIDIQQGEFRKVFERKDQPWEFDYDIGQMLLRTTYPYRIDKPGGEVGFEDRFAFEEVKEESKPVARSK